MPLPILILGLSGSGKSTSIKTLDPKETFLINCCNKPLPFKGANNDYTELKKNKNPSGNMITTDDYQTIDNALSYINSERSEIKSIVIDDSHVLILHEFMRKHSAKGKGNDVFQLYNEIADHFWNLIFNLKFLRNDLFIFFLHHAEMIENGRIIPKTVGKMLNEKIEIASMFTIVLLAIRDGEKNYFLTQNDGTHPAKTPEGMFNSNKINNDLFFVKNEALIYFQGEIKNV